MASSTTRTLSEAETAIIEHFKGIPWAATQLSDPSIRILPLSRIVSQPGSGHSLTASTWNTENTISHLLSIYRPPDTTANQSGEVRRFYTLGTGLNAHPYLLHGGVIATILDSAMGRVVNEQIRLKGPTYTAALNISYKKPVKTPGTIVARSWITKTDGRKIWVHGVIESGDGEVHATAEGMWLTAKAKI